MTSTEDPALLDMEVVNESRDLMGDRFSVMINYLIEDTETLMLRIREGVKMGDLEASGAAAHMLKSSSRQLGAIALSDIAKNIEQAARDPHLSLISRLEAIKELQTRIELVFIETKKILLKL